MAKQLEGYYHKQVAAKMLGVHPETLVRWAADGKMRSIKNPINGHVYYRKDDIDKKMAELNIMFKQARGE